MNTRLNNSFIFNLKFNFKYIVWHVHCCKMQKSSAQEAKYTSTPEIQHGKAHHINVKFVLKKVFDKESFHIYMREYLMMTSTGPEVSHNSTGLRLVSTFTRVHLP